jgi:uncharacterized protein (DUF2249 family)
VLDVREMPPRVRHPKIFETFDALAPGRSFLLINDHDPKPLFYQFQFERAGTFGWRYLEEGPEAWRVEITKLAPAADGPAPAERPAALGGVSESRRVLLDVREDIRRGAEPFARIMSAVTSLGTDQVLVLRVPFEPLPLYGVLGKRGFAHWTERHGGDDWWVTFYRDGVTTPSPAAPPSAPDLAPVVDVRGLEPPEPMVRVLESLDALPARGELVVLHERRPMFLYPQLDARGFVHETDEPEPGLVRIRIRRGEATAPASARS